MPTTATNNERVFTQEEQNDAIRGWVEQINTMAVQLDQPAGHHWSGITSYDLNWFSGDIVDSTRGGLSLLLRPLPATIEANRVAKDRVRELDAQVKIFYPTYKDARGGISQRQYENRPQWSVQLWAEQGQQAAPVASGPLQLVSRAPLTGNLFDPEVPLECFIYAETLDELLVLMVERMNAVLARARPQHDEAEQTGPMDDADDIQSSNSPSPTPRG